MSPYGVSKLAVERYLFYYHVTYGIDVGCLRYANVYGERQNPHGEAGVVAIFLQRLLAGDTPIINGDVVDSDRAWKVMLKLAGKGSHYGFDMQPRSLAGKVITAD